MTKYFLLSCSFAIAACGGGKTASSEPSVAADGSTSIADIQGSGSSSPLQGQSVMISAIVSGDFQTNDEDTASDLGGFYVQNEAADQDSKSSTGIFVFEGDSTNNDVAVGDRVEVRGTVEEFFGETQIKATSVRVTGNGIIRPTDIDLPSTDVMRNESGDYVADLERYEGMLVRIPQRLTVTNLRNLERFGEVGLSQGGRLFQFTNSHAPSARKYENYRKAVAARSILLDDGKRSSNPTPIRYLNAASKADYSLRGGDSIGAATGNLRFSRGSGRSGEQTWRLMPTEAIVFESNNVRPGAPEVGGSLRVASFNVLNYFSQIDNGKANCGYQRRQNCRGADSKQELKRQLAKIVSALALMDGDIVGLIEVENDSGTSMAGLVDALNKRIGGGDYQYVDTGPINRDAIKTGFIYNAANVRAVGTFALLNSSIDSRFKENLNRPALAQSFEVLNSGAVLTVIVNHLKSKGSSCDSAGDRNMRDGQGNCNLVRRDAANAIADWIKTDPTNSGDPDYLIIGDLNAYPKEEPLTALRNAGLENLLDEQPDSYSFVFNGQAGALDYALATPSLRSQVVDTIEWHINADEPSLLDYNLEHGRDPDLLDADSPYRASDHDPIVVGLELTR
jgi:predicted extracellular nuclease